MNTGYASTDSRESYHVNTDNTVLFVTAPSRSRSLEAEFIPSPRKARILDKKLDSSETIPGPKCTARSNNSVSAGEADQEEREPPIGSYNDTASPQNYNVVVVEALHSIDVNNEVSMMYEMELKAVRTNSDEQKRDKAENKPRTLAKTLRGLSLSPRKAKASHFSEKKNFALTTPTPKYQSKSSPHHYLSDFPSDEEADVSCAEPPKKVSFFGKLEGPPLAATPRKHVEGHSFQPFDEHSNSIACSVSVDSNISDQLSEGYGTAGWSTPRHSDITKIKPSESSTLMQSLKTKFSSYSSEPGTPTAGTPNRWKARTPKTSKNGGACFSILREVNETTRDMHLLQRDIKSTSEQLFTCGPNDGPFSPSTSFSDGSHYSF